MVQLTITSKDDAELSHKIELTYFPVVIGRTDDNNLVLRRPNVSRHHAQIEKNNGSYTISDLRSANGTYVNNRRIYEKAPLSNGDVVSIGDYILIFETDQTQTEAVKEPVVEEAPLTFEKRRRTAEQEAIIDELKSQIHSKLIGRMDLKKMDLKKTEEGELKRKTEDIASGIIEEMKISIPQWVDKKRLLKEVIDEALGLGPLEDLLADPTITEIMVNRKDQIYIERNGKLELVDAKFSSDRHVLMVIERIVAPLGRRIDESMPMVDARLKDGSRVNAIIPPLSLQGPMITIRKFSEKKYTPEDLIKFGSIVPEIVEFLKVCVIIRKNIVISGGTGSGKTTLLNILACFIPNDERIITIEDAAELRLPQEHIGRLEARPPNIEGKGAITIRDLVRNALRMRPDRIVVGECRGGEALDMLQAMNTGHDGSLTTIHSNSPKDALSRLETMVLMAGMELPSRAIRDQIASAINIIVQIARFSDGTRKITHVSEIVGIDKDGMIDVKDIFRYKQTSLDENGKVHGEFYATGYIPEFVNELETRGIKLNPEIFKLRVKM